MPFRSWKTEQTHTAEQGLGGLLRRGSDYTCCPAAASHIRMSEGCFHCLFLSLPLLSLGPASLRVRYSWHNVVLADEELETDGWLDLEFSLKSGPSLMK